MARTSSGGRVTGKASGRRPPLTRGRKAASEKRANASSANGREEPLVVFFDDIRLVRDLLGDYDANLAVLEDRLGIQAVVNGNVVSLRGPEQSRETARSVLEQLYGRLAQGEMIGVGEVVGAIRHARTPAQVAEVAEAEAKDAKDAKVPAAQQIRTRKRLITARTPAQSTYLSALQSHDLVFATGPAGTGKTYLAVAFAAACMESGKCDRLILSRPAVEAGERLGFLPGDMRGRTLSHAMIILDEAQNTTSMQMKMFLTRIGEGSKMIVTGDPTQIDLPAGKDSGLLEAVAILEGIEDVAHIAFTGRDVVRRELVGKIVDAYEAAPKRGERNG